MSDQLKPYEMMHRDPIGGTVVNSLWYRKEDADTAFAAKDAEIARLNGKVIGLEDCAASNLDYRTLYRDLRDQLAAKPARQVGGDDQPVAAVIAFYEGQRDPSLLSWNRLPNGEHRLYAAALAPAAVVMPERRAVSEASREQSMCANSFNAALDEVARLNRNPIPVELLESLSRSACRLINEVRGSNVSGVYFTEIGDNLQHLMALEMENDELRTLLGKEGE